MTERTSLLQEVGQAFRDNGLTAAITALVGGCLAVAATVTRKALVIPPFLTGCIRRIHGAIFSFWAGVMPPIPMFGRSLL